jgi:hypothetical protein
MYTYSCMYRCYAYIQIHLLICELQRKRRNVSRLRACTIREIVGELRGEKRQVYTERKMEESSDSHT